MFQKLMTQFSDEFGELEQEEGERYRIPVTEQLSATVEDLHPVIQFRCEVGAAPKEGAEEFYEQALAANLFGLNTGGAVLGLTDEGSTLVLQQSIDYTIPYSDFSALLEDFCNAAELWAGEI